MRSASAHWSDALVRLDACAEAVAWARTQPDYATAWDACPRGDWLLWLVAHVVGGAPEQGDERHRALVRVACDCAELVLRYVPAGELRPSAAIAAARAWAEEPTEERRSAASAAASAAWDAAWAARAAARDAAWAAAWDAAWAAAWAASAAWDAAWAASDAWAAASAAWDAASAACDSSDAASAASDAILRRCAAAIVRRHIARPVLP